MPITTLVNDMMPPGPSFGSGRFQNDNYYVFEECDRNDSGGKKRRNFRNPPAGYHYPFTTSGKLHKKPPKPGFWNLKAQAEKASNSGRNPLPFFYTISVAYRATIFVCDDGSTSRNLLTKVRTVLVKADVPFSVVFSLDLCCM